MIAEILSPLRPDLSSAQLAQFETYYAMLADWNTRVNLTAITAPEDVAKKHFLDSLAAAPYLKAGASVADVGTGAGFPGMPLRLLEPDFDLTLPMSESPEGYRAMDERRAIKVLLQP